MNIKSPVEWATDIWVRCCSILQNSYQLKPETNPVSVMDIQKWNQMLSSYDPQENNMESRALLKGNIARECFNSVVSPNGICPQCIDDLAMEFARQMLDTSEEKHWLIMWDAEESTGSRKTTRFYRPSKTFPQIDLVGGPGTFSKIIKEIIATAKSGIALDFDDFVLFLRKRLKRIAAQMDQTDVRIVSHLVDSGKVDNLSVAKALNITPEWVSRKIGQLRKRGILRRFDRVPFSRVGIRMFNLFVDSGITNEDPFKFLEGCPFLYAYYRVLTGKWDCLAILAVPDNITSMKFLADLERILKKWGLDFSLFEIASSGTVNCFDHYDVSAKQWSLPWELLEIHLKRIFDSGLAHVIDRIDSPANRTRIRLDELDMQILEMIRHGDTSVSKVRNALRIGQQKTVERIRRLREERLIDTTWEVHNVGLNEPVIVTSTDVTIGRAISAWSQRLPRAIASFDVSRNLTLLSQLPRGGVYGLTKAMSFLAHKVDVGVLDEKIYGGWGFPTHLWDVK
ncbi:MAG: Lrp/AsnC family transcriptional regulator, partial [Candidatus Thorarchaeota archaeon]|nr:Lrp/AsnC family transcriptional regulator [Candidatus Thorarchaeota archaeon]